MATLPEVEPPRSFRLTPAMVAGGQPVSRRARPPLPILRLAQGTAAVAVAALMAVVVVDLSGTTGSEDGDGDSAAGALSESASKPRAIN